MTAREPEGERRTTLKKGRSKEERTSSERVRDRQINAKSHRQSKNEGRRRKTRRGETGLRCYADGQKEREEETKRSRKNEMKKEKETGR